MVSIIISALAFGGAVWLMLSPRARSKLADNQGRVVGLFTVIVVVGVLLILSGYNGIFRAPLQVAMPFSPHDTGILGFSSYEECPANREKCFYGVIFDAGSTGSRIHVYQFKPGNADSPYKLMDELFIFNKKGLSTFAKSPKEGAETLRPMLDQARKYIPSSHWEKTPLALKATAGLRLLDKQDADSLLEEVAALFKSYLFHLHPNFVTIMEGNDEGIFSWFTLNFLKGAMEDKNKMMGVLDLGGGSTQITFVPTTQETRDKAAEGYLTKIKLFGGKEIDLYTHSYLGLGLMSGRFQTIGGIEDPESNDEKNPDSFTSSCLASDVSQKWKYAGKEYQIMGKEAVGSSRYEACYGAATSFIQKYKVQKVSEILTVPFVTISYYYDRAVDSKLIEEETGGEVTLGEFIRVAKQECSSPTASEPFLCLDLSYITALLKEGFGYSEATKLHLQKKVNKIEVTWGLGAVIELFNKYGIPS